MDISTVLAIWGALLSTAAIGWNLYRDITDRGNLRVTCYFANIEGVVPPDPKDYLHGALFGRASDSGTQASELPGLAREDLGATTVTSWCSITRAFSSTRGFQ